MNRTTEEVMGVFESLSTASWTAAALGALFESGVADGLSQPSTVDELAARCRSLTAAQLRRCLAVAAANDLVVADGDKYRWVDGVLPLLEQPMRSIVQADFRTPKMQGLSFLDVAAGDRPRVGWMHDDPRVLKAQGEGSVMIARMLKRRVVPELEGLAARMDAPGARFLDIGVGVAALAVELCRVFPNVSCVGIDVHDPALAIARDNVAAAKMNDRVELRKLALEDMRDEQSFDLAWLPSFFIPSVRSAAPRIHAAMRPGGWVVCALVGSGGNAKQNAVTAFVGELWGGEQLTPDEASEMFRTAGFSTVRPLPSPAPGVAFIAARR